MRTFDLLFRSQEIVEIFSDRATLQAMLDFEAALARAQAKVGVIPAGAAVAIASKCRADLFDLNSMASGAALSGNLAIPLVKQLTALVQKENADAAQFVHWGATSQDAIDTGAILQLRRALGAIDENISSVSGALATLASKYRLTPIVARTWLQHALPTSFGFKIAGWLDAMNRHRYRLQSLLQNAVVLQFGGAVGTLASLGNDGPAVAQALAADLSLPLPIIPWHTHRDRIAEVAACLGLLAGTLGKIARDLSLHMQTDVAELAEPAAPGRGGSSAMPHKRNPVACSAILANVSRIPHLVGTILSVMPQEHERGIGNWQAEWEVLPEIVQLTGGALTRLTELLPGLQVDETRMRENLDASHGLIYAEAVSMHLARRIGKIAAHEKVEQACETARAQKKHLQTVMSESPEFSKLISPEEMARLFDPMQYLGSSGTFVDHVIAVYRNHPSAAPKKD